MRQLEMNTKIDNLRKLNNAKNQVRATPAPLKNIRSDVELTEEQKVLLDEPEVKEFQHLAVCINWLIKSTRVESYFSFRIRTNRAVNPALRNWDIYCLVWCMEFIVANSYVPLVSVGPIVSAEAMFIHISLFNMK